MKTTYLLLSISILIFIFSVGIFLHIEAPNSQNSFSYRETTSTVAIKVLYDPDQALQVERYVDSCLQPEIVFGNNHKVNKDIQLNGQIDYHVKASPGKLNMTADKETNSIYSLYKIKNILEGLKRVIRPI